MGKVEWLIVIFVFGVGVSFVVIKGLMEARLYRLTQLKALRAKRHTNKH